ncbi:MAG: hypothetical protein IMW98_11020 [Firmicutes bacterium]|nr:hypothetical protein [Bacillota bacterium]
MQHLAIVESQDVERVEPPDLKRVDFGAHHHRAAWTPEERRPSGLTPRLQDRHVLAGTSEGGPASLDGHGSARRTLRHDVLQEPGQFSGSTVLESQGP